MQWRSNRRRWLWPVLAVVLAVCSAGAKAQGIIYGQFPPTIVPPPATSFPEDAQGTRLFGILGPATYDLSFNGQVVCTFDSDPTGFTVTPSSSLVGVIAIPVGQIGGGYAVPLIGGQAIGPAALGYAWMNGITPLILTATADFGSIGYFTGVESAYLGLQFQQAGQTFYGWVRLGAPAFPNGGWLYDYGYQTNPDVPILAGQIPEPSSGALVITLCSILCLFRKRK
jgi:hypothetical protein